MQLVKTTHRLDVPGMVSYGNALLKNQFVRLGKGTIGLSEDDVSPEGYKQVVFELASHQVVTVRVHQDSLDRVS